MGFRNLSKLLAIAPKYSRSNRNVFKKCSFSHKKFNVYLRTQSCKENKLTPICVLLNSPSLVRSLTHIRKASFFQWRSKNAEKVTHIKGRLTGTSSNSLQLRPLSKLELLLKDRFASEGSEFFPLRAVSYGLVNRFYHVR